MLHITKNSKIYIAAPANTASGGAEALHQLAAILKEMGFEVFIYYFPEGNRNPLHSRYKHYNIPFTTKISNNQNNILIVPEVFSYFKLLNDFPNVQKVVWWLSVDNFYASYYFIHRRIKEGMWRVANKLSKLIFKEPIMSLSDVAMKACKNIDFLKEPTISKVDLHLVQSYYAKDHLIKKGITNIENLSDYLNSEFLSYHYTTNDRENIVLYNPNKGFKFTKKIIAQTPGVTFLPIKNMSRQEVIDMMKKAKLYIDFGHHPGKDRMPREAAMCGCCVITGKRGSAEFYQDIPLSNKYKFEDKIENIPAIADTIKYCVDNYKEAVKDFDEYREFIKKDKDKFMEDVQRIFLKN